MVVHFSLSVFCRSRHVVHALLEGHEAAKAAGLSQKNPVEQVWQNIPGDTCLQFFVESFVACFSPVGVAYNDTMLRGQTFHDRQQ